MIFRYPGGKSKKSVRERILSFFPKQYNEFREAMVGGGGVFFSIPSDKKRWINDKDVNLIAVYEALRDRSGEFIGKCREIKPAEDSDGLTITKESGNAFYNARLKKKFDYFAKAEKEDQALRYFFIHRTVWAGRVNYDIESRMYFSNPKGWNVVHTPKMEKAASIIKGIKITSGDFENVLLSSGDDVIIYVDPPYYLNTELSTCSKLYKYNFSKRDHNRLFEAIKTTKHKIVLSYDGHKYIRELYNSYNISSTMWKYCGTSSAAGQSKKKRNGDELIITNF